MTIIQLGVKCTCGTLLTDVWKFKDNQNYRVNTFSCIPIINLLYKFSSVTRGEGSTIGLFYMYIKRQKELLKTYTTQKKYGSTI